MKKFLFSIIILLCVNIVFAAPGDNEVIINGVKYKIEKDGSVKAEIAGPNESAGITDIVILDSVTINGVTYPVTKLGKFHSPHSTFTSITIGSNITTIDHKAFENCTSLESITFLGETAPTIQQGPGNNNQNPFAGCINVTEFNTPYGSEGYENILNNIPNNGNIVQNEDIRGDVTLSDDLTMGKDITIKQEGVLTISNPKILTITSGKKLVLNSASNLNNNGIIVIEQGGEFIVKDGSNGFGIIEVKTSPKDSNEWHFIGAPFANYKLETIIPGTMDPSVVVFVSEESAWSENWAGITTPIASGEGFMAYSWCNNEPIIFTNYGDGMYSPNSRNEFGAYNYDYSQIPIYQLNNGNVVITETLGTDVNNCHWMALANPYTFKLDVATFIANQGHNIQGQVFYTLNGETFETLTSGNLNVTQGFFVNFTSAGEKTITFTKNESLAKSAKVSTEREFMRLAMLDGEREIELLFAQNEDANEEYDIFDANKLFSLIEIAEPYFVVNNIELVKEEVNTLPYYATMNVRSYGNKEVTFKANHIPEGLSVSIIDGEETIDLGEGVEYTTNVIAGENADRFKVLIKKSLSINDAEELEVNIYNDNRHINIEYTETDLQVEVYNALGQKVLSTNDRNFTLNQVSAGAYLIKAFNDKSSKTAKVVLR